MQKTVLTISLCIALAANGLGAPTVMAETRLKGVPASAQKSVKSKKATAKKSSARKSSAKKTTAPKVAAKSAPENGSEIIAPVDNSTSVIAVPDGAVDTALQTVREESLTPATIDNPRGPFIEEAPKDDYARVAWCHGALSAHMALADHVQEVTPLDPNMQMIGTSYLRAYEAALTLSKKGENEQGRAIAETARKQGFNSWATAFQADIKKAAYAYDTWQLPGDCEIAAVKLSGHPQLFEEMATDDEMAVIESTLTSSAKNMSSLPQPKIKAVQAPEDPNAPVASTRSRKKN